jgi:hypothetical protein
MRKYSAMRALKERGNQKAFPLWVVLFILGVPVRVHSAPAGGS